MGHGGNSRAGALACHEEAAGGARLFFLLLAQLEPVDFVARPDSCEAGVVPLLPDALRLVAADSAAAAGVAGGRPPGLVCFGGLPGPGGGGGSGAKKLLMQGSGTWPPPALRARPCREPAALELVP